MATWAEFRQEVIILLGVDYRRNTLRAYIDQLMRQALVDIQRHIQEYRTGHVTVFGPDELQIHGTASIGRLPSQAHIEQLRFRSTGYICRDTPLDQGDWEKRHSLACCSNAYQFAVDPVSNSFWVNPQVTPGSQVVLYWNGRKSTWNNADEVNFDPEVALLVSEFVMSHLESKINRDRAASQAHMGAYAVGRKNLALTVRDRKWQRASGDRTTTVQCAPACGPYDINTAVEWVCFGDSGVPDIIEDTAAVAKLAMGMQPDFIVHLGDTNYPSGDPVDLFDNLIKHFGSYFRSAWYQVMGNHDYDTDVGAYLLSQLPHVQALMDEANVGYCYQFSRGPVDFFVVNTGGSGADNIPEGSAIPVWLEAALAASDNDWKVVFMHKAPNLSDVFYGPEIAGVNWNCLANADAVISGHGHNYERLHIDGQPRFVVGTGGATMRGFLDTPAPGSQFRYNAQNGVLRCSADAHKLQFVFHNTDNVVIDNFTLYPT